MNDPDLQVIYDQLKDRYDLILTNAFSLNAGFTVDCPVLTGKAAAGTFYLYLDDFLAIFDVENPEGTAGTHWHPYATEDAMKDVEDFMSGKEDYDLHPYKKPR